MPTGRHLDRASSSRAARTGTVQPERAALLSAAPVSGVAQITHLEGEPPTENPENQQRAAQKTKRRRVRYVEFHSVLSCPCSARFWMRGAGVEMGADEDPKREQWALFAPSDAHHWIS